MTGSHTFTVDGPPTGKGRPRFVRATGRPYTPKDTELAENRVLYAWQQLGLEPFEDGPLGISVTAVMARPKMHRLANGDMSSVGRRSEWPTKKPDIDNVVKLVCDALARHAYRDDAQIVTAQLMKRWAVTGEREGLIVQLWAIPASSAARLAA